MRPPGLTDKDDVFPPVDARGKWTSFMTITKKSVAQYLLQTLESNDMDRQTLTVREDTKPRKKPQAARCNDQR